MTDKKVINWGILSTARINRAVIPPIKEFPYSHLYAIASRSEEKARAYATEHGFEKAYGSYQALLDDPAVDAIYISLPNGLHYEWMVKALDAGKHILCEKSITTRLDEVIDIKERAEEKNLLVMEGFMYRYHAFFQKILEYAHSDRIGEIQNVYVSRCARQSKGDIRLQPGLGPGVMGDVGCYCLNFSRTIMGAEPQLWDSRVRYDDRNIDMEVAATLVFEEMKSGQFFCSFTTNGSFASIIGDKGRLNAVEPFWVGVGERDFVYIPDGSREPEIITVRADKTGHALEIEDFTLAILENRRPYLSLQDSIGNLRVLQDIVENGTPMLKR